MLALNLRSDIDLQTEVKIHGADDQPVDSHGEDGHDSVDDHGVDKD